MSSGSSMLPHSDLIRFVANAAAVPTVVSTTVPVWGPPAVELFGVNVPIGATVLSMIGLAMARGVSAAREGKMPGGHYLTGTLAMVLLAIVIEQQPGPGIAIAEGVGVGASGILLVDLLRDRIRNVVYSMIGKEVPATVVPPPPSSPNDLSAEDRATLIDMARGRRHFPPVDSKDDPVG